ncbi:MAG: malonyl-CoA decarboxylase family protein [Alphaproteobacteria bacterium]|nr:malonyl-CoA decarboxylase family protein [Alphaproteobacteria bacterium]
MLNNLLSYVPSPSSFVPSVFRLTADAIEFSTHIFKSKPTHSGTLVRLTYDMVKKLDMQYPGFIDKLMAAEIVAPYPKDPALIDAELQKRFGVTHQDRCVFAILDDKGHPNKTPNEPLSIIYAAFGHDGLANTLKEILDGSYGRKDGKLPKAVTFYSAINLAFNDADEIRKKLSRGIGGRQVEETRSWLKEHCSSWLKKAGTLSPLIGYEKWLLTTTNETELKDLRDTLAQASNPITLEQLRNAITVRGAALASPEVLEASERAIAYFVMRTKEGKDGKSSLMDNACGLHVGNGGVPAKVLLGDPEDPRMRYEYSLDDGILASIKNNFVTKGIISVSSEFRNLLTDQIAKAKNITAIIAPQVTRLHTRLMQGATGFLRSKANVLGL